MLESNNERLLGGLLVAFLVGKLHVYRRVRGYLFPVVAAVLAYRYFNSAGQDSLLDIIVAFVRSEKCPNCRVFMGDILGLLVCATLLSLADRFITTDIRGLQKSFLDQAFNAVKEISVVKKLLATEQKKLETSFDNELKVKSRSLGQVFLTLPKKGLDQKEILKLMKTCTNEEAEVWENGMMSGSVYNGKQTHQNFLNQCFSQYSISNALHPDVFPSVMKFDSEIIAMTASLVNGGLDTVCGATSSGGTESIILAVKAHRDYYRDTYNITQPEIVAPASAHAAVDKACDLMNIKLIKVPVDPTTYKANISAMRRAIGPNTIMLYGSAPGFPQGAIDDIRALGKLATRYNIGLHVDCCLGGFVLPFARKLGYKIPDFDFSVPGVTSMSLDTHKYGYALKGASVVLYRNKDLIHSQYFCFADWTGGMYTTPGIAGSRSGGLIAQCWASLVVQGEEGYMQQVGQIMEVVQEIAEGVRKISGLKLCGEPEAMIVCFTSSSSDLNIYQVGDQMHKKGWHLNALQNPASVHICCTVHHVGKAAQFLKDLQESVNEVSSNPNDVGGKAAIYGTTSSLPAGPVNELLKTYNDVILRT